MEQLDLIILSGAAVAVISLVLFFVLLIRKIVLAKSIKQLRLSKTKRKKERRKNKKRIKEQKKTSQLLTKLMVGLFLLTAVAGGVAGYANYYQKTNLYLTDQQNLTEGTLYTAEIETILLTISDGQEEEKKETTMREISKHMASLSNEQADSGSPQEVQILLNRYYKSVGEVGINLVNETVERLKNNPDVVAGYLADIERIMALETQIYEFYGIQKEATN